MKPRTDAARALALVAILIALAVGGSESLAVGVWENVGPAGVSAEAVAFTNIAFDSAGPPDAAYTDSVNGSRRPS